VGKVSTRVVVMLFGDHRQVLVFFCLGILGLIGVLGFGDHHLVSGFFGGGFFTLLLASPKRDQKVKTGQPYYLSARKA